MTKKLFAGLLALSLMLMLALPGLAENDNRLLTVSGSANVSIDADFATIEIGVTTRGGTAMDTQTENERIMQEVITAITALEIKREDIRTSMFNIYADHNVETKEVTYVVSNTLAVTIKDIDKVSQVIDAAARKGANNVYSLSFQASKNPEAIKQAITLAVKDARDKAAMLAEAAGISLGDIIRIDLPQNYGGLYMAKENMAMAMGGDSASAIVSGKVTVSADVTIVFGIK